MVEASGPLPCRLRLQSSRAQDSTDVGFCSIVCSIVGGVLLLLLSATTRSEKTATRRSKKKEFAFPDQYCDWLFSYDRAPRVRWTLVLAALWDFCQWSD